MATMRHVNAAASVIHYEDRILVVLKDGWDQFCIPVTKLQSDLCEGGGQAAARDFEEVLGTASPHEPRLLLDDSFPETSLRTGEIAHYNFQIYDCELPIMSEATERAGRWLTVDELLSEDTEDISPTARRLIERLREASLEGRRQFPPVAAEPRRTSTASVSLISRDGENGPEWLAQYNESWGRYFLIGGHQESGETPLDCLLRELHEEIGATPEDITATEPMKLQFTAWSTGAWELTDYMISSFSVTLSDDAVQRANDQAENRWLSESEICRQCCNDGKFISSTMHRVLVETGDIPPE